MHEDSDQTYGRLRLSHELQEQGVSCSQKRVARLMRLAPLYALAPKRFVVTKDSNPALPVAENLLDREFSVQTPKARGAADLPYVWTAEGWLYRAVVLDLFSRRVVGWAMGATLERSLVVCALNMAVTGRQPAVGLLCHSDRGSQYASGDYQQALRNAGATCRMSRKGNCGDNAPTESFCVPLKKELVHRCRFATRQEAQTVLFRWIEVWYNRKRRHSSLGYVSPEAFEQQHKQQQQRPMAA